MKMKLEKAITLLAAVGSILAGVGEMLKQFNVYQQRNRIALPEEPSKDQRLSACAEEKDK